ncbi:acyltransferase family protein [Bradyrhizobium erythrophlei]|uniref:Peptidoglycan/LPS O-acetylase OafA/YrhL, contains acyltransferase and SGNH-hydrolase domains n=1 Tax=Bradyrhizobium erythrophlei TaxID=1437360 RepID=A0A1M5PCR6_9BRAD|nr:acyltransferase [Bradyrhizobium erythrophlei]SHG99532.1 Peptidoglycan/LPS O-acetylase OafA/YrhL, contains acyltransferase and SGNH-hydrolase domains [Bradyrhizobium erythrophlei]
MKNYFYGIDVLRFLAAFLVAGFHLGYLNDIADFTPVWLVTWFGWIGVEVFFVISGFVIANSANGKTPAQFLRGRALRLYPAVWFCATLTLIVRSFSETDLLPAYLRSIMLIPKGPWIDDVYWTLAVEVGFYCLVFLLLLARMFSQLSRAALALTLFSSISLIILATKYGPVGLVERGNVLLARHGCFFALGAWIWISTTRRLLPWERIALTVAIVACIGEIYLRGREFLPAGKMEWMLSPVVVWFAAVACIFIFSRPGKPISEAASRRIRTLGLMTYPLYLVHHIVGLTIERHFLFAGKWFALVVSVLSAIAISWIVCALWEPSIKRLMRRDWNFTHTS